MHHLSAVVTHKPAAVRALSSKLGALVLIGRGPAPRKTKAARYTGNGDVVRQAVVARTILSSVASLEGHPDLLVALAGEMVHEINAERTVIADALRALSEPGEPLALVRSTIAWIADDIEGAERDDNGSFEWSLVEEGA